MISRVVLVIISGVVCGVFICCVVGGGVMIVSGGQVELLA